MRTSLAVVLLVACTPAITTPPPARPGSRGLRASEHVEAAREHDRRAKELARWPDSRSSDTGRFDDPNTGLWYRAWDTADTHEGLATSHRSEAAHLQAAYDEACPAGADEAAISPLQHYGVGGAPTRDGILVFLAPSAGPPDRLMAAMRCHRAWMMLGQRGGRDSMDDCPLDLAGVQVEAQGDVSGITVELKVRDLKLVPELQRRIARDLEIAAQRRKPGAE